MKNFTTIHISSFAVLLLLFLSQYCLANNLLINNAQIASVNATELYAEIEFDISWENSWRDAENWDAIWVFIKFREISSNDAWEHATLNYVNGTGDGHTAPSGSTITTPTDGKGVFIYRDMVGEGTSNYTGVRLRWNFGVDGLNTTNTVDLKVMGIEMVHVPQGSFYLGDGQTNSSEIYGHFEDANSGNTFQVINENALTLGGGAAGSLGNNNRENSFANDAVDPLVTNCANDGCLVGSGDDFDDSSTQSLPAAFPKGFNAFYCMKYELSQQQFTDMLNCLTATQQATLTDESNFFTYGNSASDYRYGITGSGGVYSTTEPYLPMIYCDWIKGAAFADWAGLRPMTEMEFEKACRGTGASTLNEYAWGNDNIDLSDNFTLNQLSQPDEGIASGYDGGGTNGNVWVAAGSQSMNTLTRIGIFAAHASNSGRVTSGASYWGIMEMSGHAWERAVSVGHAEGRKFTGAHGDGTVDADGYADVPNWPGTFAGTAVNSNIGVGYRGGALAYPTPNLETNARVSSRRLASGYWNTVIHDDGIRLVRTSE